MFLKVLLFIIGVIAWVALMVVLAFYIMGKIAKRKHDKQTNNAVTDEVLHENPNENIVKEWNDATKTPRTKP